jgi:hypothetical protein
MIHPPALSGSYQQIHLVAKQKNLARNLSYSQGFLTLHKILRLAADGFTSPPKEVVLRIIITRENSSSAVFEPADLGVSGKHANHYSTEGGNRLSFYQ